MMSVWSDVAMMCSGNFSCWARLTFSCQLEAMYRSPVLGFCCGQGLSPALTKVIDFGASWCLLVLMAVAMVSLPALSTWSWRQRKSQLPFGQRRCSKDPLPKQRGQEGVMLLPQMCRFAELCRT